MTISAKIASEKHCHNLIIITNNSDCTFKGILKIDST